MHELSLYCMCTTTTGIKNVRTLKLMTIVDRDDGGAVGACNEKKTNI